MGQQKRNQCLSRHDSVYDAARKIVASLLAAAQACEEGIAADMESLHDYRVSLRKVRSALSLFSGVFAEEECGRLKASLGEIMEQTNRLRDLDVYLQDKDDYFPMVPESIQNGLHLLFDMLAKERADCRQAVAAFLTGPECQQTMARLRGKFEGPDTPPPGPCGLTPALPFARALIWKRYRKTCRLARHIGADTPDEVVHKLRIACKKLRYLMEFFEPFFPAASIASQIKSLKRLQENLGRFNDYSVQQCNLAGFLRTHRRSEMAENMALAESAGALMAVLHQLRRSERSLVLANAARFGNARTRAKFKKLFAAEPHHA
jgi:CHAD domain-containing protein